MAMNKSVVVSVPATTANMGPGFDCLGMSLNLFNEIHMTLTPGRLDIDIEGEGAQHIARNEENIVYMAACRVFTELGETCSGLSIKLVNQIPASRGLGSSAAAIVGGLVAANELMGGRLTEERLLDLATEMEGHPDNVAPALLGGIIVSVFQDSKVYYLRIDPPPTLNTIVAVPEFHLSTHSAREVLPKQVSLKDAVFNLSRSALLVAALCQNKLAMLKVAGNDVLHQPYRAKLIPGMNDVISEALKAGALNVTLSGAGPTVIALTDGTNQMVKEAMETTFNKAGVSCQIKELKPTVDGARII